MLAVAVGDAGSGRAEADLEWPLGDDAGPLPPNVVWAMGFGAGWNGSTTAYCWTLERFLLSLQNNRAMKSAIRRASPPRTPPIMGPRLFLEEEPEVDAKLEAPVVCGVPVRK